MLKIKTNSTGSCLGKGEGGFTIYLSSILKQGNLISLDGLIFDCWFFWEKRIGN